MHSGTAVLTSTGAGVAVPIPQSWQVCLSMSGAMESMLTMSLEGFPNHREKGLPTSTQLSDLVTAALEETSTAVHAAGTATLVNHAQVSVILTTLHDRVENHRHIAGQTKTVEVVFIASEILMLRRFGPCGRESYLNFLDMMTTLLSKSSHV